MDFSTILKQKRDSIIEKWVKAVFDAQQIESSNELTFNAIKDGLPKVLDSLAAILSQEKPENFQAIDTASLEHGLIRAEQRFEPSEIVREYRLLRSVIFSSLEDDLVQVSSKQVLWATRLIDRVVDEAIAHCFDSYTQSRIAEVESLNTQMQLTNQELTRLVQASRDRISHLTHEMKTPLTSIIGYAEFFLRQQQMHSEESYAHLESIERILRGGRLLLRLINDTLQLQQNAGQLQLTMVSTSPEDLIQSVIEIVEPLARNKGLELSVDCDRAPPAIQIDPLRFQQILTNLLSNAIRYTDSGDVTIFLDTRGDDHWTIEVRDSGIGMSEEVQNRIFEPYFRVGDVPLPENSQGTGLGLAVVAQLIELMQGEIQVSSQMGEGSTFTVILPITPHS